MTLRNHKQNIIDFDFVELLSRFLGIVGSSFTPPLWEGRTDSSFAGELGTAKINLLPLGLG
jgi:hypothetical protein